MLLFHLADEESEAQNVNATCRSLKSKQRNRVQLQASLTPGLSIMPQKDLL